MLNLVEVLKFDYVKKVNKALEDDSKSNRGRGASRHTCFKAFQNIIEKNLGPAIKQYKTKHIKDDSPLDIRYTFSWDSKSTHFNIRIAVDYTKGDDKITLGSRTIYGDLHLKYGEKINTMLGKEQLYCLKSYDLETESFFLGKIVENIVVEFENNLKGKIKDNEEHVKTYENKIKEAFKTANKLANKNEFREAYNTVRENNFNIDRYYEIDRKLNRQYKKLEIFKA